MALFSRVTNWVSNQVLTAAALNGEFNNILTNAQLSSWVGFSANVGQMQQTTSPGGVGTESLAASGSDELQRLRYMFAALTGLTQWYQTPFRTLTGAFGQQIATTSTGSFSDNTGGYVDVTNATLSITTHGRPVFVGLQPDGTTDTSTLLPAATVTTASVSQQLKIQSNNGGGYSDLAYYDIGMTTYNSGSNLLALHIPVGCIWYLDTPLAGTWTYKLQAKSLVSGMNAQIVNTKMIAFEL